VRFDQATTPAAAATSRDGDHKQSEEHPTVMVTPMNGSRPGYRRAEAPTVAPLAAPEPPPAACPDPSPCIDDDWRRWIAENLMLDGSREILLHTMTAQGISPEEAGREIDLAAQSPYVRGSERLRNRLRKREWLLAAYRKVERQHTRAGEIERRHKLSREAFLNDHYSTNRPVIITGMMDDWPALRKWNLDFFAENYGDREVEVQQGRSAGDNYEIERERYIRRVRFGDFVERVRSAGVTNDFYLTANNNSSNKKTLATLWDDVVQVPEYLDGRDRMSGYLWLGPAGTVTPFHHDLTNNFMAQVIGRKRVKIAPSWDMPLMANDLHCYSRVDGRVTPADPSPAQDRPQIVECLLDAGEILFLPIGCLHYVEGVDISVTVSFTNFLFDNDFHSFYTTYHGV
jgi:Cupin-like domain